MTGRAACLWLGLLVGVFAGGRALATAPPGMAEFESGVSSYRAGDYDSALGFFLAARGRGLEIPNLYVNLGLTFYKLRRYDEAQANFERVSRFPGYEEIARFHLGLIAARLGERERAADMWRETARTASEPALRHRSRVALGQLGPEFRLVTPTGYVLLGLGRDSNPALLDGSVQPSGGSQSSSVEMFGAFDYPVNQASGRATVLRGGAYARDYSAHDSLDQAGAFAGLSLEHAQGARRVGTSFDITTSSLGGEHFTGSYGVGLYSEPGRRDGLAGRVQLDRITASEPYRHLEGWRLQSGLELKKASGQRRWRGEYQFEANERRDWTAGSEFSSQSPLRHRLGLRLDQPIADRWFLQWSLRYRHSTFREPDRYLDGGALRETQRIENLAQASAQFRRKMSRQSNVVLEYQYSHNTATIDAFAYQRHLLLIGYEWVYSGL